VLEHEAEELKYVRLYVKSLGVKRVRNCLFSRLMINDVQEKQIFVLFCFETSTSSL